MVMINGYFSGGDCSGCQSFTGHYQLIDKVIPAWLELRADGSLKNTSKPADKKLIEKYMGQEQIIPLLQNYRLQSTVSNEIIKNVHLWPDIIDNIVQFLLNNSYRGINLDLEGVKRDYKDSFTGFVALMSKQFKRYGLAVELSLPAKAVNFNNSAWSGAYDYRKLSSLAARIIIMAYDYHWSGGPAGPIAPLFWVRDVIDYAIMKIAPAKIILGIPCYGYNWNIGDPELPARGLSWQQVRQKAAANGVEIEWDQESSTPYARYDRHEIWFENKESITRKLKLVSEFQLAGIALWRLGLEDPGVWSVFQNKL